MSSLTGTSAPERFLVTPPDLHPAKADLARDYYNGQFRFAGQTVQVGNESPFLAAAPSPEWEMALHGFRWLRHMAAAPGQLPAAQSKTLVGDWLTNQMRSQMGGPFGAELVAIRLIAFLQHGRFLLTGAEHVFYRAFMRGVAVHVSYLQREVSRPGDPLQKARIHVALALAGVCLPVSQATEERTVERLGAVLDEVISADGGFASRSPDDLADIIADLLCLAKSCVALNQPVPLPVVHALDRAMPRLRCFVHRDGELATFAGAGGGKAELVSTLLANDETAAKPTTHAPQTGFVCLRKGESTLILDAGRLDTKSGSGSYQACSALEFSHADERICINVGMPPAHRSKFADIARAAAAHNRLVVIKDGLDASDVSVSQILHWPDLAEGEAGYLLPYEIFVSGMTLSMLRGVRLSADGRNLDGFDRFSSEVATQDAAIYFHTPVKTIASTTADGTVVLHTRGGQQWRINCDAGNLSVQPSLQLAHPAGKQDTICIRIAFDPQDTKTVAWRWAREA